MAIDFRPAIRRALAGVDPGLGTLAEPQWVPVASTNVAAAKYDDRTQTLFVRFHSGGVYEYNGVSRGVYEGLLSAASAGRYVYYNIAHAYPFSRVA